MKNEEAAWWKHILAGNVGGAIGLSSAYPMDTLKTRIQTRPGQYKNSFHCLTTMVNKEGVTSLYRGLTSPVVGYGLINAAVFSSYGMFKSAWLGSGKGKDGEAEVELSVGASMAGGAWAGLVQSFVRAPVEQIKTVMQGRNKPGSHLAPYRGSYHCITDVLKTEGVRKGLYRGLSSTIFREVPQYSIYFPSYELSKHVCHTVSGVPKGQELNVLYTLLAGAFAGVMCWLPTYPTDVIKSRIHVAPPGTYAGFLQCGRQILREEGMAAMWRGMSPALVRAFPLHGFVFVGYEFTMRLLQDV